MIKTQYIRCPLKVEVDMFAKANIIAKEFTRPFIISSRKHSGSCDTGIGTYVIVNEEGWFVTAYHIINQIVQFKQAMADYNALIIKRKEVEALDRPQHIKKGLLNKISIDPNSITNYSLWLGDNKYKVDVIHALPAIDLAIGKIENFDKNAIKLYPKFKDYSKPMDTGTSLCKLGFPLSSIKSTFDEVTNNFNLPHGSLPIPLFPLDGIYTRTVQVLPQNNIPVNISLKYIETSTPGLRGQSGGPTFDINGTVWAIQSSTQHHKLGFGDKADGLTHKEAEHLQNQYLNVGWGIHSQTIIEFFKQNNVSYNLSDY